MAGIGFELRKIYKEGTAVSHVKGAFYASAVVSGPMVSAVAAMLFLHMVSGGSVDWGVVAVAVAHVTIFELVVGNMAKVPLSKWLSDMVYLKDSGAVSGSLAGALSMASALGAVAALPSVAAAWGYAGPGIALCLLALGSGLCALFVLDSYISLLGGYKAMLAAYGASFAAFVVCFAVLRHGIGVPFLMAAFVSVDVFYGCALAGVVAAVARDVGVIPCGGFEFVRCYSENRLLMLCTVLVSLGTFMGTVIFWAFHPAAVKVGFLMANQQYDCVLFIASVVCVPSEVMFVVNTETVFYEKQVKYLSELNKGSLKALRYEEGALKSVLAGRLLYLVKWQAIIVLAAFVVYCISGNALRAYDIQLFAGMILVKYFSVLVTFMYYFSDYVSVAIASGAFCGVSVAGSAIACWEGSVGWQPYPLLASGIIGVAMGGVLLARRMRSLTAYLYSR